MTGRVRVGSITFGISRDHRGVGWTVFRQSLNSGVVTDIEKGLTWGGARELQLELVKQEEANQTLVASLIDNPNFARF